MPCPVLQESESAVIQTDYMRLSKPKLFIEGKEAYRFTSDPLKIDRYKPGRESLGKNGEISLPLIPSSTMFLLIDMFK